MRNVSCSCKRTDCTNCGCSKHGLKCTELCGCAQLDLCQNRSAVSAGTEPESDDLENNDLESYYPENDNTEETDDLEEDDEPGINDIESEG